VRILEEDAKVDEEVAELLDGAGGDPDIIRARMEQKLASPVGSCPPRFSDGAAAGAGAAGGGAGGASSSAQGASFGPAKPSAALFRARTGVDEAPHIAFREVDVFDLWVWLEFVVPPSAREQQLLQSTLQSWFVVGKLGGFNTQNLQVGSGLVLPAVCGVVCVCVLGGGGGRCYVLSSPAGCSR
jgi:hypothetical protein